MKLINENQIYILNQPPTKVDEIVESLLPCVPESIHWVMWSKEKRKLFFCQELPRNDSPTGLVYEIGLVNSKVEDRDSFLYEIKFPPRLGDDTKTDTPCFEDPHGERFFFMDALKSGGFAVYAQNDPNDIRVIKMGWEVPE